MITIIAGTPAGGSPELATWLEEHDLDPKLITKLNIRETDMTVYQYDTDDQGEMFMDPVYNGAAKKQPFDVPVLSPLPEAVQELVGV